MEELILKVTFGLLTLGIYVVGSIPFVGLFVGLWVLQMKENEKQKTRKKGDGEKERSQKKAPDVKEIGEQVVDFGIHEGKLYRNVPVDYLEWMTSVGDHHRHDCAIAELARREERNHKNNPQEKEECA